MNEVSELTLEITAIRAQNGGESIVVTVLLTNEKEREHRDLVLTTEQYGALKPRKGTIDEGYYDALEQAATLTEAIRKGTAILGYGANSKRALVLKLCRHGFLHRTAEEAADYLEQNRCLNEDEDAVREAERDLAKLWGRRRILEHLRSRGYEDAALHATEPMLSHVDFGANCRILLQRKYPGTVWRDTEPSVRRKIVASLIRFGYSMEEIRSALS